MRTRDAGIFGAIVTLVAVVGFVAGALVTSAAGAKTWADPDEGLTDQQRLEAQQLSSETFWKRYESWLADEVARGVDPRTYDVDPALASVAGPAPTLAQAVLRSRDIVVGVVDGLEFRASADVVVRVRTTETLKGEATASIGVVLPNGLMPDPTWTKASIAEVEGMPMIYPGDQVVLFLTPDPLQPDLFNTQAWTGIYRRDGDGFRAVQGNPFGRSVDAMSMSAFVAAVKAAHALEAQATEP